MEKYPASEPRSKDSSSEADQWIGSPEHFESAKTKAARNWDKPNEWREDLPESNEYIGSPEHFEAAKDKAYTPTDWASLEEWRQEHGPAPWNDPKWQAAPSNFELATLDAATSALYGYTEEDAPADSPQTVTRKQLDPVVSGMFAAAAFMAVQIVGIGDSPSNFVLENPAAATTLLASSAAAIGAATGYGIGELNAMEKIQNAKHAKPNERSN